ncbi:hypothetical protein K505DRAFT_228883, partial [Melanomma pulvis-pyrius CBS 109.77]
PPYIFKIDEIEEDPNTASHVDNLGNWTPSTDVGANHRVPGGISGRLWYCNRQRIFEVPQLPQGAYRHKRFSVYYGGGYGFWVLRGDATEPPGGEVWLPLRFDHSNVDYSSFLTNAGQNPTLRVQRNDQHWPNMLLPDIYHASVRTDAQVYGGLTGELPIFLALLAFSLPREFLPNTLPNLFTGGAWLVHGYQNSPMLGTNQRGVIVTVYTCPTTWAGGSTSADLEEYEQGHLGKYYN